MDDLPYVSFDSRPLRSEECRDLLIRCAHGDMDARERIILSHIPLVLTACERHGGKGVASDDLFQEGCYGLILALEKYDYTLGHSFAPLAKTYIEKYVKKALINQNIFLPIPYKEDFFYELQSYLQVLDEQTERLNRTPTDKELAKALHKTENEIRKLSQSLLTFFPIDDLVENNSRHSPPSHLQHQNEPEKAVMSRVMDLSRLGVYLHKREREVLARRFGFTDTGIPESLTQIAASMDVSHERVRQIYDGAINRIRKTVAEKGLTINTIEL